MSEEEAKPSDKENSDEENENKTKEEKRSETGSTRSGLERNKTKVQLIAELNRVKREMVETKRGVFKPALKPYTPDIFNSLSPYYNTYLVNYMLNDQSEEVPRTGYGSRSMALDIVEPEISWRMDDHPGPIIPSRLPESFFKPRNNKWSKNLSGLDPALGSTRLPPIPPIGVTKFHQPEYQHFKMNFNHVPAFRDDVRQMRERMIRQRSKNDFKRTANDWQRMNLDELRTLPITSRHHVKAAVVSYLGTSKGSKQAVSKLAKDLDKPNSSKSVKS